MSEKKPSVNESSDVRTMSLAEFLESSPPNHAVKSPDLALHRFDNQQGQGDFLATPELQLHCPSDSCNGTRFFRCVEGKNLKLAAGKAYTHYLRYRCSNCLKSERLFSLSFALEEAMKPTGAVFKFGEMPPFGPPTPPKLIKLVGQDRDNFLKGRRCENQGLGVGAFIYYRRVVENQKNRILAEIIKVSEKLGAAPEKLSTLRDAMEETQFSKAMDMAKDVLPEALFINGHSPIKLLHSALSEGVHALSDEDCLELASSVRVLLAELSEKLGQALKDEAELSRALTTLMNYQR